MEKAKKNHSITTLKCLVQTSEIIVHGTSVSPNCGKRVIVDYAIIGFLFTYLLTSKNLIPFKKTYIHNTCSFSGRPGFRDGKYLY